jgi:hypothetical protein
MEGRDFYEKPGCEWSNVWAVVVFTALTFVLACIAGVAVLFSLLFLTKVI